MSTFSEVFRVSSPHIESLVEIAEPAAGLEELFDAAAMNPGLDADAAASLIAWARDPACRAKIHAAAQRVRREVAPPVVEFVIPVYLTSFCLNESTANWTLSFRGAIGRLSWCFPRILNLAPR